MDKAIEKKSWPASRIIALLVVGAVCLTLAYMVVTRSGSSRLQVDPTRIMTAMVENGEFREYYPFDGTVEPLTTVYLDIEEGGRVDEILIDGGQHVEKGDLILKFSNATLQRNSIDTETKLLENLDILRNTQFNRAQASLILKDQLLDLEHRIKDLEKRFKRNQALVGTTGALSKEAFEQQADEVQYLKDKRDLLRERIRQEDFLSQQQLEQANESIQRLTVSLELLNSIVEKLDLRAPIAGFLSNIDAQIGQNINRGQRIGQIDQLEAYKIRVNIDQYYISRVTVGTTGKFDLDGKTYLVEVSKIYPEVVNDVFMVDVAFVGAPPPGIRRGQRLTVELSFSEPTKGLMVAKGGFFQQTGGRWVYLLSADGRSAYRTSIRLGRQNPKHVEVLEGLKEGDWIISSGYDTFNQVDELQFNEPLKLSK